MLAGIALGGLGFWFDRHCNQRYMPKATGYCRIDLPEQQYQLTKGDFPYQFEYSACANVLDSSSKYKKAFWMDIYYPSFEATIYISYQSITEDPALLTQLCHSASALAFKHKLQASSIEESIIQTPKGHQATVIELFGQVPTPFQFYTTDGKKHFLRGALYFKTASQNDFLEPVIEFIKKDIIHMLNTLEWKS
ncbi:gliding motility lipoprotein GldD [Cardinium endosymbiont of Tipula unca]|uniref:gliding motility lipoprotein GldD n=1 Tax=Cardinium endosymbiont of Tipula unca TaxID=3066216 RepID=UPI0030CB1C88